MNAVLFRETLNVPLLMLPRAAREVIRHADVKRSVGLAGAWF